MSGSFFPSRTYLQWVAVSGFVLLFPGFFFYHLGVAANRIPPFAAGLFGPASVLLCILFLLPFVAVFKTFLKTGKVVPIWFAALVLVVASWTFVHYAFGTGIEGSDGPLKQSLATLASWIALFFIGIYLPLSDNRLKIILSACFAAMLVVTLFFFDRKSMMLKVRDLFGTEEHIATYQGFSRSALFTAVYLVVAYRTVASRWILIVLSAILMFLLGSRSELYGFLLLILAFSLILSLKSWRHTVIAIASIFLLSLGATLFAEQSSIMKPLASSRQMQVLDLDKASSWIGRQKLQQVALEQIKENPITGKYAGHYYAGGPGSYSHNALSAWVNYGFIGFCAYLGLIVYCFAASFLSLKGRQANPEERNLAFAVNFLCLLLVIVAKPVFWSMPALGWGIMLNPEA